MTFRDERRDFDKEQQQQFDDAMDLLDGNQIDTPEGGTALRFDAGAFFLLVTLADDATTAPDALDAGPVIVSPFDGDTGEPVPDVGTQTFPTLRAFCLDLYGNIEGCPLPSCLED